MTTTVRPAALEHVEKTLQIGVDVTLRMLDRVAHAGLGGEMHDLCKAMPRKQRRHRLAIREIGLDKGETALVAEQRKARLFQRWIVIAVEIVEPDHGPPFGQQLPGDVKADETGGPRDQNRPIRHPVPKQSPKLPRDASWPISRGRRPQ